jgi:hypothetical protein
VDRPGRKAKPWMLVRQLLREMQAGTKKAASKNQEPVFSPVRLLKQHFAGTPSFETGGHRGGSWPDANNFPLRSC